MKIFPVRFFVVVALVMLTPSVFDSTAISSSAAESPKINPELLSQRWSASWITVPGVSPYDYGVYHFRRTFDLESKPQSFVVHVTGDNRYQLFVNGERVVWGPARGDLFHWRYETVDIAKHLKSGKNVLAAVVWNFGQYSPEAQVTNQTAFLLQGNSKEERVVDTNKNWKCFRNPAYQPLYYTHGQMRGYFVVGPGDKVDGTQHPWGWEQNEFNDSGWDNAETDGRWAGSPRGIRDAGNRWMLVPRDIPLMEETPQRLASVRQSSGVNAPAAFPAQPSPFTVPANTKARLLVDQSHLTTAYPELIVSGGRGAVVSMGYAESMFDAGAQRGDKGNRNEIEGKEFVGYYDIFTADGGQRRMFRPLWWRTYRYLELNIETKSDPITIEDLRGVYTGYPFEFKARIQVGDANQQARLDRILEVGWRTARLCAHETYMDCPYYEQLQYAGDTRIQCLISLYNSGDARLVKNAISQLDDSRTPEGLTMSRAPTRQPQYIPPFSLWWIGILHDYWMYQDDPDFVRQKLPGTRTVLNFYSGFQKENHSLKKMPFWNYVDWTNEWNGGVPPIEADGSSALLDLQLLLAYDWAAQMEDTLGSKFLAMQYRQSATNLRQAVKQLYWDSGKLLFADTPAKKNFSQQANILAVIARVVTGEDARQLINRIIPDKSLTQASYYFRHYLHEAVNLVGEGDRYLDLLDEWDSMLARGLTTWAERPEGARNPSRSDCHAWSSSPNFELFRTVLGIDSAGPGFKRVLIKPHLGKLTKAAGSIPHPDGEIIVNLELKNGKLEAEISLPPGVTGIIVWNGINSPIGPGKTKTIL